MFTDGFADQFGGTKAKKFKYKPLQNLLKSIAHLPCIEQKQNYGYQQENNRRF